MSTQINNKGNNNTELVPMAEVKPAVQSVRVNSLTDNQKKVLKEQARKSVEELIKVDSDVFTDEADIIANIGLRDQMIVSNNVQLMQENLGDIFYNKDKTSVIENMSKDISQLQTVLAKIHPKYMGREARYQFIQKLPFFGGIIVNMFKEASAKGMSLKSFVDDLSDTLKRGELTLRQDYAQLKVIKEDLKKDQAIVESNAYSAEVIIDELNAKIKSTEDAIVKNNLNKMLARVSSRLQNIRTTENVIQQFITSIISHKENYDGLLDASREVQSNGLMIVNNSMIIQTALVHAKNVKDLLVGIGEFEGKMLLSNATAINRMTDDVGEMRKNPFIPIKYVESSVLQLNDATVKANKMIVEIIESSKGNSAKLKAWTEDLKIKSGDIIDTETKSLEASETLALPIGEK